jgi:hypothetical protein
LGNKSLVFGNDIFEAGAELNIKVDFLIDSFDLVDDWGNLFILNSLQALWWNWIAESNLQVFSIACEFWNRAICHWENFN